MCVYWPLVSPALSFCWALLLHHPQFCFGACLDYSGEQIHWQSLGIALAAIWYKPPLRNRHLSAFNFSVLQGICNTRSYPYLLLCTHDASPGSHMCEWLSWLLELHPFTSPRCWHQIRHTIWSPTGRTKKPISQPQRQRTPFSRAVLAVQRLFPPGLNVHFPSYDVEHVSWLHSTLAFCVSCSPM